VNRIFGKGFCPEDRADQILSRFTLSLGIAFGHKPAICCAKLLLSLCFGLDAALNDAKLDWAGDVSQLNKDVEELPVDSTVIVRARSALGLKYVQPTKGTSSKGFQDGATIPLPERCADIVIAENTFEHLTDYRAAIAEMRRILRSGTRRRRTRGRTRR